MIEQFNMVNLINMVNKFEKNEYKKIQTKYVINLNLTKII